MSEQEKYEEAKKYVDHQLDTMKRFDAAPNDISPVEYQNLISEVAELIAK